MTRVNGSIVRAAMSCRAPQPAPVSLLRYRDAGLLACSRLGGRHHDSCTSIRYVPFSRMRSGFVARRRDASAVSTRVYLMLSPRLA